MRRRGASRAAPGGGEIGRFWARPRKKAPPRGRAADAQRRRRRASVRHSSRRRADDLRSSREVARAAADPFVTSSFHKQAVSTRPLRTRRLQSIVRPSRARPRHRKCSAHAHATGGPRATRRAGSVRRAAGTCPDAPPRRGHPRDHNRVPFHVVVGSETAYGRQLLGERFRPTGRRRRAPSTRRAPGRPAPALRPASLVESCAKVPYNLYNPPFGISSAARPLSTGHASGTISFWALRARGAVPRPAFRCGPTRGTCRRPATSAASQRAADGRAGGQNLVSSIYTDWCL